MGVNNTTAAPNNIKSAANVRQKATGITLKDGNTYELQFTLNAMAELEEKYGSVEKAFTAMDSGSFKAIRCILWAGMLEQHPELTEMQVGSMVDLSDLVNLTKTLNEAATNDTPAEEAITAVGDKLPN